MQSKVCLKLPMIRNVWSETCLLFDHCFDVNFIGYPLKNVGKAYMLISYHNN